MNGTNMFYISVMCYDIIIISSYDAQQQLASLSHYRT